MAGEKKKGSFSKIENRKEALKMVKDTSLAFFFIAALQAIFSYWLGYEILVDAALFGIGAFFLRWLHSRVAAVFLLALALLSTGITIANKMGEMKSGGNNIILAMIILWAGIRAVEATFKLNGRFSTASAGNQPERA